LDENHKKAYRDAVAVLRKRGIVALPTDTVYGLVAVAADPAAVERVYETKVRDPSQPMPLFVGSLEQADIIAEMTEPARRLAEEFWPGTLTIVLRKKPTFATRAAAGADTIGVRMPGDPVLREMALQLGPLTGTSANIAGREECHTADEVRAQLGDAVDLIVDAPLAASGRPSTIADATRDDDVRIVREGGISRAEIEEALAGVARVG
jgi:L-threonylcarbamoyladenylate synthase